jgi:predicted amidophosphoribosyltransferase
MATKKTKCPKCGAELDYSPEDAPFCEQCGARLSPKSPKYSEEKNN